MPAFIQRYYIFKQALLNLSMTSKWPESNMLFGQLSEWTDKILGTTLMNIHEESLVSKCRGEK